jgi:hypothetical protein
MGVIGKFLRQKGHKLLKTELNERNIMHSLVLPKQMHVKSQALFDCCRVTHIHSDL